MNPDQSRRAIETNPVPAPNGQTTPELASANLPSSFAADISLGALSSAIKASLNLTDEGVDLNQCFFKIVSLCDFEERKISSTLRRSDENSINVLVNHDPRLVLLIDQTSHHVLQSRARIESSGPIVILPGIEEEALSSLDLFSSQWVLAPTRHAKATVNCSDLGLDIHAVASILRTSAEEQSMISSDSEITLTPQEISTVARFFDTQTLRTNVFRGSYFGSSSRTIIHQGVTPVVLAKGFSTHDLLVSIGPILDLRNHDNNSHVDAISLTGTVAGSSAEHFPSFPMIPELGKYIIMGSRFFSLLPVVTTLRDNDFQLLARYIGSISRQADWDTSFGFSFPNRALQHSVKSLGPELNQGRATVKSIPPVSKLRSVISYLQTGVKSITEEAVYASNAEVGYHKFRWLNGIDSRTPLVNTDLKTALVLRGDCHGADVFSKGPVINAATQGPARIVSHSWVYQSAPEMKGQIVLGSRVLSKGAQGEVNSIEFERPLQELINGLAIKPSQDTRPYVILAAMDNIHRVR